jgi:hypothetical protein
MDPAADLRVGTFSYRSPLKLHRTGLFGSTFSGLIGGEREITGAEEAENKAIVSVAPKTLERENLVILILPIRKINDIMSHYERQMTEISQAGSVALTRLA